MVDVEWPHARAWLDDCRDAASRIEPVMRELSALTQARDDMLPWKTRGTGAGRGGGTHSDPTAAEAERRIGELGELIEGKRHELDALQEQVGECLRVIGMVRESLGDRHAVVLELYYLDRANTWTDVAREIGVTYRRVHQLRVEAYAYIEVKCSRYIR